MRKLSTIILAGLTAAAMLSSARAADLPFKAQAYIAPAPGCTPQSCSGFYVGMGLSGNGTNANIVGNGINGSVFAAGGNIDLHAGYQLWNGTYFAAFEVGVGNDFQPNQSVSTLGISSLTGYEVVKLGMGLSGLVNQNTSTTVPGQAPTSISVPAALANALMSPYIAFGASQRGGVSQWVSGAGAEFFLASHWNLDIRYLYATPASNLPSENKVTLGLNYHFAGW